MTSQEDQSTVKMLASAPIFSPLGEKILTRIVKDAKKRSFVPGEKLVSKGEKGMSFFLILQGSAEVRADGKVLATLAPPQFFGEMALLDEQPRSADVVATSAGNCLVVSKWEFWGFLSHEPDTIRILFQETVRRLRAPGKGFTE